VKMEKVMVEASSGEGEEEDPAMVRRRMAGRGRR